MLRKIGIKEAKAQFLLSHQKSIKKHFSSIYIFFILPETIHRNSQFRKHYSNVTNRSTFCIYLVQTFIFLLGQLLWLCLLWFYRGFRFIYYGNLFGVLVSFFAIPNKNFVFFLTDTGDFSCNSPEVLPNFWFPTHKWWVYQRINAFKLTGMFYNRSSLMILVKDAKYIQFLPIFSTSSSPFTLQV